MRPTYDIAPTTSRDRQVHVLVLNNPLAPSVHNSKIAHLPWDQARTAADYAVLATDGNQAFYIGQKGRLIAPDTVLAPGDCITVVVVPAGGGDKNSFWRIIAMVIVMVLAVYLTPAAYVGTWKAAAFQAAFTIAGSFMVNAFFPPVDPTYDPKDLEESPNYSWGAPSNAFMEGAALPSLVGERRFAPPRIGGYRFLPPDSRDSQRLRMLFALCEDQIEALTYADIFINDKSIEDFHLAYAEYTVGIDNETFATQWFQDTVTEQNVGTTLSDVDQAEAYRDNVVGIDLPETASTWTATYTVDEDVTEIRIFVDFPDAKGSGSMQLPDSTFELQVRYRQVGTSTWSTFSDPCRLRTRSILAPYDREKRSGCTILGVGSGQYELQFAWTGDAGNHDGEIYRIVGYSSLGTLPEVTTNGTAITRIGLSIYFPYGLYYANDTGDFEDHTVTIAASIRQTGETTWLRSTLETVTAAHRHPIRRFIEFTNLDPDQYDIQCFVTGTLNSGVRYEHTTIWEFVQESIDQAFTYPGVATLALDIPASEALHGQWPRVEVFAKVVDPATGRDSRNPAWAAMYRLINKYDVPVSQINSTAFETWATFCDTNSLTVALYLDQVADMRTVLNHIAMAGRAVIFPRNGKWDVVIDTTADPVQTFGDDNIVEDTFEEQWLSSSEMANAVLVWFFDADNANRRTPVKVRDPNTYDDEERLHETVLYGVDNLEQAKHIAVVLLNQTRLCKRVMRWTSDIDAINCQVGDVVYLQTDLTTWGVTPGRVVSATSTTVTCDISLDFDDSDWSGRDLRILVRHASPRSGETVDFIERLVITNPYPNTGVTTYTLSSGTFERTPEAGSLVLIGWVTGAESGSGDELLSVKQVRIDSISRKNDFQFEIVAREYFDDAYEDAYVISTPEDPPTADGVSNLLAANSFMIINGRQVDFISLTWQGDAPTYYIFYQTKYDTDNYSPWQYLASTDDCLFNVFNFQPNHTYRFSVATTRAPDLDVTVEILFEAATHDDIITSPTNFRCADTGTTDWDGYDLDLTWDAWDVFSLSHYQIEIVSDATGTTVLRTETIPSTSVRYVYTYAMNQQDHGGTAAAAVYARLSVVDVDGNEAATAVTVFSNALPDAVTNLQTRDGSTTEFSGRNVEVVWDASDEEDFEQYEVSITHGAGVLRTTYVTVNEFIYTYEMNQADGSGTASNSVVIRIRAVDAFGQASGYTTVTLTNPAPATPGGLGYTPWMGGIRFFWNSATDGDFSHYSVRIQVEAEGWGSWQRFDSPRVDFFLTDDQATTYGSNVTIWLEVKAVDEFGSESGTADTSGETDALVAEPTSLDDWSDISAAFYEVPVLRDFTWTDNSPSAGYVAWNAGSIWYNGTEYVITAGNTANEYIYWVPETTVFATSNAGPAEGSFLIAVNHSGTAKLLWNNAIANQVIGTAWIRDAAIVEAKIADLSVTNAKIVSLSGAKIQAGTITIEGLSAYAQSVTLNSEQDWDDIANVPSYLVDTPDNSIAITGTFVGFHATGTNWPIRIHNDSGTGKFYCGNGSTRYIEWTGSALNIKANSIAIDVAEGMTVSGSGTVVFEAGTDLRLENGSSSNYAVLEFDGTSWTTYRTLIYGVGADMYLRSQWDGILYLGYSGGYEWDQIMGYVNDYARIEHTGTYGAHIQIDSGYAELGSGYTNRSVRVAQTNFYPLSDATMDCGAGSYRWNYVWAAHGTIQTSDDRDKDAVKDSDLGLAFVNALRPVSYRFFNEQKTHYGFSAQEVEDVLTGVNKARTDFGGLIYDAASDRYGLINNQFTPILVKAIQELDAKITALAEARRAA